MRYSKGELRRLTVDHDQFLWRVIQIDRHWLRVKVWSASYGSKNNSFEVRVRFDDYWDNLQEIVSTPTEQLADKFALEPVTPRRIRNWIELAKESGWNHKLARQILSFDWTDRQLVNSGNSTLA